MATDKKKSKQARHERKMAEQKRVKQETSFGLEQVTQEQINEMWVQALATLNNRIQTILETDFPETVPLMDCDFLQTVKHFSDTGKTEIVKNPGLKARALTMSIHERFLPSLGVFTA